MFTLCLYIHQTQSLEAECFENGNEVYAGLFLSGGPTEMTPGSRGGCRGKDRGGEDDDPGQNAS